MKDAIAQNNLKDFTFVTACRNRESNLKIAIQSWIFHSPAKIIICDWGSKEPLSLASLGIPNASHVVEIIRVEAESWILTWAFNEALAKVNTKYTLKLDCDHVLSEDFFVSNRLQDNRFLRCNWRYAAAGQSHVNGVFMACTSLLKRVGYYDERITTYGWDDSDLYARLHELSESSALITNGSVHHIDQAEEQRTSEQAIDKEACLAQYLGIEKTKLLIDRNRFLCQTLWPWDEWMYEQRFELRRRFATPDPDEEALIEWATMRAFELYYPRNHDPKLQTATEAYHRILSSKFQDGCYQPSTVCLATMLQSYATACKDGDNRKKNIVRLSMLASATNLAAIKRLEKLDTLDSAFSLKPELPSSKQTVGHPSPQLVLPRAKVFIDVQHGLGNRLRALASASCIAQAMDKELVLVWQPDHHCQARIQDLFNYQGVVEEESFVEDASSICQKVYNYMPSEAPGGKDQEIDLSLQGSIYLRSAFVLNSKAADLAKENQIIQSLEPTPFVQGLVAAVRHPNSISAHIRMAGGKNYEHLPYERVENWTPKDHELIAHWREKSQPSRFEVYIDYLIARGEADTIFLAADLVDTYEIFKRKYGHRIVYLPRQINDRSVLQLQYALADAILLSKASIFLGSSWSSFSELATRLAKPGLKTKMSGIDF
jgi:hypothetical protein